MQFRYKQINAQFVSSSLAKKLFSMRHQPDLILDKGQRVLLSFFYLIFYLFSMLIIGISTNVIDIIDISTNG